MATAITANPVRPLQGCHTVSYIKTFPTKRFWTSSETNECQYEQIKVKKGKVARA